MTTGSALNWVAVLPLLIIAIGAMLVLLVEVFLSGRAKDFARFSISNPSGVALASISVFTLASALIVAWCSFDSGTSTVFNSSNPMIIFDSLASFSMSLIFLASLLSCLLSVTYLTKLDINHGEYYALLLLATGGMALLVSSTNLMTLFLGIELMSIPIYVLAGFNRRNLRSNESALKYFLIGSFASAILLYGMALIYGITGHTDFVGIREAFVHGSASSSRLGLIGVGLVVVGLAFKISSVPLHQWTPDVYQGAPLTVTAYMSVTVKVAAFVAMLRVFVGAFGIESGVTSIPEVLWTLAALTMIVGNVMAIIQDNIKRMLAYSSIAHAGYILVGFVATTQESYAAVMFYLCAYVFMNLGVFSVLVVLTGRERDCERIEDLAGLSRNRPVLAALMTLFVISLAGIPGTGGFMAKFSIFSAAIDAGVVRLTILGILTSVISVYYYLRIPVVMYMRDPKTGPKKDTIALGEWVVVATCAFFVIVLGLFPNASPFFVLAWMRVLDWSSESVGVLF